MMYMPRISSSRIALHDLDDRQAGLRIERRAPELLEARARLRVVDALVIRKHHRDQARVRRALHVVLPAQRMQPGARASDLAGHQAERDQAARVVGAVHVLRDAHAPQDHRAFETSRKGARLRGSSPRVCRRPAPSLRGCSPRRSSSVPRSPPCGPAMNASLTSPSSTIVCIIAFSSATSVSGLNWSM